MSLKKEILKKSAGMIIWQIISKFIGIIYFAFIVRILKPSQYGIYGVCWSVYELFSTLFLCTNTAIVKFIAEKRDREVYNKGIKLNILIGIMLFLIVFIFSKQIAGFFDLPEITNLIRLIAVLLLLSSLRETFSNIFLGTTEIKYYIINEAFFTLSRFAIVGMILFITYNVFGMLVGLILTTILAIFISFLVIKKIKFVKGTASYKELINYSSKFFWLKFLQQLHPQIFIFLLVKMSTLTAVGFYKFLYGLTIMIVSTVPQSFSLMLFPYFSKFAYNNNKDYIQKTYNASLKITFLFSIVTALFIISFGKLIISWLFPDYIESTKYLPLFMIFVIIKSLELINGALIKATDNLVLRIKVSIIGIVLSTIIAYYLIPAYGVGGAIFSFIIGTFLNFLLITISFSRKLGIKINFIPNKDDIEITKSLLKKIRR